MEIFKAVLIIYGILCILIAVLKPPFIWKTGKFQVMKKMFKGEVGLQVFVALWGLVVLLIGAVLL
jgi:hypothetical protein